MNTNSIKEYSFLNSVDGNLIEQEIPAKSSLLVNLGDFPLELEGELSINEREEIPDPSDQIQEKEKENLETIISPKIASPSPLLYPESIEKINPQLNNFRSIESSEEEETNTNEVTELSISSDVEEFLLENETPINSSNSTRVVIDGQVFEGSNTVVVNGEEVIIDGQEIPISPNTDDDNNISNSVEPGEVIEGSNSVNSSEVVLDPDRENISLLNEEDITDNSSLSEGTPSRFNPIYRFQNRDIPGTYIYINEEERQSVLENNPNFVEEGLAFRASIEPASFLIPIYRLQSTIVPGTYLFTGEEERNSVNLNFADSFVEEGIAFYVYAAGSAPNTDLFIEFSRFQNTDIPGTYLYATGEERDSVRENFPNFFEEGIAFEAFDFLS